MYNDVLRESGKTYLRFYESSDAKFSEELLESIEACSEAVARFGSEDQVFASVSHMPLSVDRNALPLAVIVDTMGGMPLDNFAKALRNERDLALLLTQFYLFIDGPHSRFLKNIDWSIRRIYVSESTQELLLPVLPFSSVVSDMPKMMRFFEFFASQVSVSPARGTTLALEFVRFAKDLSQAKFFDVRNFLENVARRFAEGEAFEFVDDMAGTLVLDDGGLGFTPSAETAADGPSTTVLSWSESNAVGWNESSIPADGPGTTVLDMDSDILGGLDDWNPNGYLNNSSSAPSSTDWISDEKISFDEVPSAGTTVLGADGFISNLDPEPTAPKAEGTQVIDFDRDASSGGRFGYAAEPLVDKPSDIQTLPMEIDGFEQPSEQEELDVPSDKGTTVLSIPDFEDDDAAPVDVPSDKGTTVLGVAPSFSRSNLDGMEDVPSDKGTTVLSVSDDEEDEKASGDAAVDGTELPSDKGTTVLEGRAMHAIPGTYTDDFEGNEINEDEFAPEHAAGWNKEKKTERQSFLSRIGKHGRVADEADEEVSVDSEAMAEASAEVKAAGGALMGAALETLLNASDASSDVAAVDDSNAEPASAEQPTTKDADANQVVEPVSDEPIAETEASDADKSADGESSAEPEKADGKDAKETGSVFGFVFDPESKAGSKSDSAAKPESEPAAKAEPEPEPAAAVAPRTVRLVQMSNGRTAVIEPGVRFVVGKSKYSTFQVLNTNTVSRSHAVFTVDDAGACWVEDDESRNGTFVDGARIEAHTPVRVLPGQTIRMSDVMFHIELD